MSTTKKPRKNWLWLLIPALVVLIFGAWSIRASIRPGMMQTHDGLWHVQRATEMFAMLKAGQFPVRWAANLDNGFGIPLFTFVYPLPYYLSAAAMATGLSSISAIKLVEIVSYLLGGLGMYFFFAESGAVIAVLTACIYYLTPYNLVDFFVRGDIGETIVIGMAPWVLLALRRVKKTGILHWYDPIPLALALVGHDFLGPILAVAAFVYVLAIDGKGLKHCLYAIGLSLGLSAFFLVPLIAENHLLLSQVTKNYTFVYSDHAVYPWQLLYSKWGYWYSMPGDQNDGFTFQIGFANIAAAVAFLSAGLFAWKKWTKESRRQYLFWLVGGGVTVLLMIPSGMWIWRIISPLQAIQFPWRFLSLMVVVTTVMLGIFMTNIAKRFPKLTIPVALCFLVLALVNTRNYHTPAKTLSPAEFAEQNRLFLNRTTTSIRDEVVPFWAPTIRWMPTNNPRMVTPYFGMSEGAAQIHSAEDNGLSLTFSAFGENGQATAKLYHNYYPTWQATMDGKPIQITPSTTGEILIPVAKGEHTYHVWVGSTPVETASNIVTVAGIVGIVILAWKKPKRVY